MKLSLKMGLGILLLGFQTHIMGQSWTSVTTDPAGDGSDPNLLDGTEFSYYYDQPSDSIYFKLDVSSFSSSTEAAIGVNVMVNIPGGGATFNFWGSDNTNAYHKLVTTWVTGMPPSSYSGTIGVANSIGVSGGMYNNLSSNNIGIQVNTTSKDIVLSMKRIDLVTDAEMGGDQITLTAAAAVGSNMSWNDDVVTGSGTITIDKTITPTGLENNDQEAINSFKLYPNPVQENAVVNYDLKQQGTVLLELLDLNGRRITTIKEGYFEKGNYEIPFDAHQLCKGAYLISLQVNGKQQATMRFVK